MRLQTLHRPWIGPHSSSIGRGGLSGRLYARQRLCIKHMQLRC